MRFFLFRRGVDFSYHHVPYMHVFGVFLGRYPLTSDQYGNANGQPTKAAKKPPGHHRVHMFASKPHGRSRHALIKLYIIYSSPSTSPALNIPIYSVFGGALERKKRVTKDQRRSGCIGDVWPTQVYDDEPERERSGSCGRCRLSVALTRIAKI